MATVTRIAKPLLYGGARATYPWTLAMVPRREDLPVLLNRRKLSGTGVEVGVQSGAFSETILDGWRGQLLISMDPWAETPPDDYVDVSNVAQAAQDELYDSTCRRLARFGARSEVWRTTGKDGGLRIDDGSLDFVYLDARHDYESVREDLHDWWPKLRRLGIFAGHDYVDGRLATGVYGVKRAVDEFLSERGLRAHKTLLDGGAASWLAIKR